MTTAIDFFYDSTPRFADASNREHYQRAETLAHAEQWATDNGLEYVWAIDFWYDDGCYNAASDKWYCVATIGPRMVASVTGVEFGPEEAPADDPDYCRAVEAELAIEAMAEVGPSAAMFYPTQPAALAAV